MIYEWVGLLIAAVLSGVAVAVITPRHWSPQLRQLIMLGAALRVVGALLRYEVIVRAYGGLGDAFRYYKYGEAAWNVAVEGRFGVFMAMVFGRDTPWGTQFVESVAAVVVTLIGPSMRGASVIFAMLGYAGIVMIARAIGVGFRGRGVRPLVTVLIVWPSLWFWPSSIGKESLILLGIGLVVHAFMIGPRWRLLACGMALVFMVRPHIAALLAVALMAAEVLAGEARFGAQRLLRVGVLVVAAALIVNNALDQLGVDEVGGTEAFIERRGGNTEVGGSKIERPTGITAVPMAFINILARPFPWEARNAMSFISSLEMTLLWVFAFQNRRRLRVALGNWRHDRLIRVSLMLAGVLTLAYGLNYGNLGIIARQRVVILPFLFILLAAPLPGLTSAPPRHQSRRQPRVRRVAGAPVQPGVL